MKLWKQIANKIFVPKQDLKDTFANALLLVCKLSVISNHILKLAGMIDIFLKKEDCIKKTYNKRYQKTLMYEPKEKPQVNENKPHVYAKKTKVVTTNVDRNRNRP